MSRTLHEVLGGAARGLVEAQGGLDVRAGDADRWDREGLPPVALAYTRSRLRLTAPVRVLAQHDANGAVLAADDPPPSRRQAAARQARAVISVAVRLQPHSTDVEEQHDPEVDPDRSDPSRE